ncbi:glycosyltransferase family 4 protein [Flavobacterium sp.]|uniref:glycosyltransferase family 4 protein n=1 Tax=Flavobacterium sp. TaxID=239 RepID=UPI002631618D|nr:glycosyltransferase family 4 protein [Flavobacterium sp.]
MRILQLIDTLETGGAERMAVNYANALHQTGDFVALAVTRKEGPLRAELHPEVPYLFVQKKGTIDMAALFRVRAFCKRHKIEWIHAHSSSFFLAVLLKFTLPRLQIIWHDHYGLSEFPEDRPLYPLRFFSLFFWGILPVNQKLATWSQQRLWCKNIQYFPNFSFPSIQEKKVTLLQGRAGKRVLNLANLRPQKNQLLLLEAVLQVRKAFPDWTYHLVGKDFNDEYAAKITTFIHDNQLETVVFRYGACPDTDWIFQQADLMVLSSDSEGLPVSLLEAAQFCLPVVATAVGEIPFIIHSGETGVLVPQGDVSALVSALTELMASEEKQQAYGTAWHHAVKENFSATAIIQRYKNWTCV